MGSVCSAMSDLTTGGRGGKPPTVHLQVNVHKLPHVLNAHISLKTGELRSSNLLTGSV
ncbi:hypothetical protein EYF80_064632 [Liparis tanakae]|uniref:Uncharacterized protein n=1 Tax=Liparis tanakae TaxID=230148 RepID=A0A4Z2E9J4_9TELE|nr:hypothetical protein EYF80_064632 [Liparis tanakae]